MCFSASDDRGACITKSPMVRDLAAGLSAQPCGYLDELDAVECCLHATDDRPRLDERAGMEDASTGPWTPMRIVVRTQVGTEVPMKVQAESTVVSLKTRLRDRLGIGADEQKLVSGTTVLSDDLCAVAAYGVQHGSILTLLLVRSMTTRHARIFLKLPAGEIVAMEVPTSESVGELKARVCDQQGLSRACVAMRFRGWDLCEHRSLKSYNIEVGNVVHFVVGTLGSLQSALGLQQTQQYKDWLLWNSAVSVPMQMNPADGTHSGFQLMD